MILNFRPAAPYSHQSYRAYYLPAAIAALKRPLPRFRRYLNYLQKRGRKLKLWRDVAEKELQLIRDAGAELFCHGQEHYPAALLPFDDAPFI